LFGPAIAGLLIAVVGEGICFLLNGLSYIAVIIALLKMQITYVPKEKKTNLKEELTEGFRYTFGFPPIKTLLLLLSILSLAAMPYSTLMPAYASVLLKGGSHTLGFIMSASGAGALCGAIYLASRKTVMGLGKVIAFNAIIFGAALMGISFSANLWISLTVMVFLGFSMIAAIASINMLVQTLAEEEKRGRVMSFYAMALMGMNPIGNLCAGSIASGIGISYTLLLSGIITIIAGIVFALVRSSLRKYTMPIYIRKGLLDA
jgi:predicted MFS family arabinose efflux permease